MVSSIADLLSERARISAGLEAIVDVPAGVRLNFADIEALAARIAAALAPMVDKGDRLAMLAGNSQTAMRGRPAMPMKLSSSIKFSKTPVRTDRH